MYRLAFILFLLIPYLGVAQTDTVAHLYAFGGGNNDVAEEIEATADGGFIIIGSTSSNSWGNTDAYLLKIDSNCNYEWSKALGGPNNDWGYSVKQTFDKGYIIALSTNSYGNGGYDACLMKRDSMGNYEWKKTYGGNDWDFAYSVVQTHDSGFVFCGETYNNSSGFSDVYVVKTNQLGDTIWTRTVGGALIDKGNSVIETSDSNIVVAGIKNTITDSTQIYMLKFDINGTLLWDSLYGDSLYEIAYSIIEANNGDYILGGASTSFSPSSDKDYYLIRSSNNGNIIWANQYGSPSIPEDDEIFDVAESNSGDVVVVGYTEGAGGGMKDVSVFYVNSGGFWLHKSSTYGGLANEVGKSLVVSSDIKIAGLTDGKYGNGLEDVLVICLDTVYQGQMFDTDSVYDAIPLKIKDVNDNDYFSVFPNPAQNYIVINSDNITKGKIRLLDITGKELLSGEYEKNKQIPLVNLISGFYFIEIYVKEDLFVVKKIVISR